MLIAMSGVGLESLDVVKPSLEEGANKTGEEGNESKGLQGFLERALVDEARRVRPATRGRVVVLCSEDKSREPEVGEDPGEGPYVSLVFIGGGKDQRGNVEGYVDGCNREPVDHMSIVWVGGDKVGRDAHNDDRGDPVEDVIGEDGWTVHLV